MKTLPPLLIKGNLISPTTDTRVQQELDTYIPIEYIIKWFRDRLRNTGVENRILIIKSKTASGKSTIIPTRIFTDLVENKERGGIICTQPRILTAIENVKDIVKRSPRMKLGTNIGWLTQYNKLRPTVIALTSATIGTLTQQLISMSDEDIMKTYKFILIDETHERDLQTDMTIYMLKNLVFRNKHNEKCPFIVLMSATFDPHPFLKYFGVSIETNYIECEGAGFHKEWMWEWNENRTISDYGMAAADLIYKIVKENQDDSTDRGDVLIFLPGKKECIDTKNKIMNIVPNLISELKTPKLFTILNLESKTINEQSRDYELLFLPVNKHAPFEYENNKYEISRRIILSTNVAETGITLDNLKYVIDSGYDRTIEYFPTYGLTGLITKPAPISSIIQRVGRVGRTFPGIFYPLYPKYIYERLQKQRLPKILTENIAPIVFSMYKTQGEVFDPKPDMIDTPSKEALAEVLEKLYTLGFIEYSDEINSEFKLKLKFTEMGKIVWDINDITPESIRMILASYFWRVHVGDLITIAAFLASVKTINGFVLNKTKSLNWRELYRMGAASDVVDLDRDDRRRDNLLFKIRLLIADDFINGLIIYNAIKKAMMMSPLPNLTQMNTFIVWCESVNLKYSAVLEFLKKRDAYMEQFLLKSFDVYRIRYDCMERVTEKNFMDYITRIKHCIYDGYRLNILKNNNGIYYTNTGLKINKPALFNENEEKFAESQELGFVTSAIPNILCYGSLNLKANSKTGNYSILVESVSTMDGYVAIDDQFNE